MRCELADARIEPGLLAVRLVDTGLEVVYGPAPGDAAEVLASEAISTSLGAEPAECEAGRDLGLAVEDAVVDSSHQLDDVEAPGLGRDITTQNPAMRRSLRWARSRVLRAALQLPQETLSGTGGPRRLLGDDPPLRYRSTSRSRWGAGA